MNEETQKNKSLTSRWVIFVIAMLIMIGLLAFAFTLEGNVKASAAERAAGQQATSSAISSSSQGIVGGVVAAIAVGGAMVLVYALLLLLYGGILIASAIPCAISLKKISSTQGGLRIHHIVSGITYLLIAIACIIGILLLFV